QQVKRLTEALTEEAKLRKGAEQQAGELGLRHSDLEAELAKNKQAHAQLRQELEASQKHLHAHQESSRTEQTRLEGQAQELQAAKLEVERQVTRLMERLAAESWRREGAEQQAGELGLRRSALEAELANNKQAQAQLSQELEASQKQLQA